MKDRKTVDAVNEESSNYKNGENWLSESQIKPDLSTLL